MKRFSIFCAALFAAATSFATVTYELNGGVTNDDNWLSKADMWEAFKTDAGVTSLGDLATLQAAGEPALSTICTPLGTSQCQAILDNAKWDWLEKYIMDVQNPQVGGKAGSGVIPELTAGAAGATWRYALAAFFVETQKTGWPYSADFSGAGKPESFIPSWQHAFANPTEPTGEWVLNAPYKEGESFLGWYWNADFSGDKVTTINAESNGTLYAKFGTYIPTIVEVKALADDTETKAAGVVNFISGKNIYIQDATGGILVYTSENPTCQVGQKIVVKGTKVMYGGAPEVKNAVVESAEAAELPAVAAHENLATLVADTDHKCFATRVTVPGLKIVSYDSYNNPTVQDALGNTAVCYRMVLDPVKYPVGGKVTVTAVAGWYNGFQFVGDAAGIELVIVGKKDQYEYPVRTIGDYSYTLTNDWVISNNEDNFSANKPGSNDYVRGMAVKDGIMYFINRETKSIVPVNGATAEMLEPIVITGEHVFERASVSMKYTVDTTDVIITPKEVEGVVTNDTTYVLDTIASEEVISWASAATLPYNDIKFDWAGNCLIGACVSGGGTFQIYMVDLETGAATLVVEERLYDNPDFTDNGYRFDAFGVAGDVTQNGVIMAADATSGSWAVYRWLIEDGVASEAEQITALIDPEYDESLYVNVAGWGTAPQIFPQDEIGSIFYVDGFNMLPMLFDEGGMLLDDFIHCPAGTKVTNKEGDVLSMNTGHNGLAEFQVGEEYFLLITASNTAAAVTSSFALYKFADEAREFAGLEPLWYFPAKGMGSTTNGCRTAVPSVEVVDDNTANLYLYTNNNGYARYTLKLGEPQVSTALEDVNAAATINKVVENGHVYIIKNDVKFNVLGTEVK